MKELIKQPIVFIFDQGAPNLNLRPARSSKRPQTGIHLTSANLEMHRAWRSVWISVVGMTHASWRCSRAELTASVCPVTKLNSATQYWIAC